MGDTEPVDVGTTDEGFAWLDGKDVHGVLSVNDCYHIYSHMVDVVEQWNKDKDELEVCKLALARASFQLSGCSKFTNKDEMETRTNGMIGVLLRDAQRRIENKNKEEASTLNG